MYNLNTNEEGDLVGGACENGLVKIFKVDDKGVTLLQNLAHHKTAVFDAVFAGDKVVSAAFDGGLAFWRKDAGGYVFDYAIPVFQGAINTIAVDQPSSTIYCGCSDGRVRKVACTGDVDAECSAHKHGVTGVSLFNDYLVTSGMDGTVKIWDKAQLALRSELKQHNGPIRDAKVCPNPYGAFVFATCSDDGSAVVYTQKEAGSDRGALLFHAETLQLGAPATKLSWSKSGYALSVGYGEGQYRVFLPQGRYKWQESPVVSG